jgi:hypothetical protein
MAMDMWQMSRGRAIDVRFYDVVYTRHWDSGIQLGWTTVSSCPKVESRT